MSNQKLSITIAPDGALEIDIEAGDDDACDKIAVRADAILGCMGISVSDRTDEPKHPSPAVALRKQIKSG